MAPVLAWYSPAAQLLQPEAAAIEKVPTAQLAQLFDPVELCSVPGAQLVQALAPPEA